MVAALATFAGAVTRFGTHYGQALWIDEYLWTRLATASVPDIVAARDGYPPLFGIVVRLLQTSGFSSDAWLRAPSAAAGVLTVPLLYVVGARLRDRRTGAMAALFLAVNPLATWYSIELGAYALLMLCALVGTLCLVNILKGARFTWALAYGALTFLAFGLHYYYVFFVMAHVVAAVVWSRRRRPGRTTWIALGAALLAICSWLPNLQSDLSAQALDDANRPVTWGAVPYTALTFVGGLSLGPPVRGLHEAIRQRADIGDVVRPYVMTSVTAIAVGCGLMLLALWSDFSRRTAFLLTLVLLPIGGALVASVFGVGYRPRYVAAALPFFLLLCAESLRSPKRKIATVLCVTFVTLEIFGLLQIDARLYAREDNRAAAFEIARQDPSLPVVLLGEGTLPFVRYAAPDLRVTFLSRADLADELTLGRAIARAVGDGRRFWLVSSRPWTVDGGIRAASIRRRYAAEREWQFPGVRLGLHRTDEP